MHCSKCDMGRRKRSTKRMRKRKRLLMCGLACLLALTLLALCRQIIAQKAVEAVFSQVTSFPMRLRSVQISPWHSRFAADGIQLFNPPEFTERLFADIPRVHVDYTFCSLLRDPLQLTRVDLHIRELVIVKDTNGHSNFEQLRGLVWNRRDRTARPFRIDTLNLEIGSITTKDYSDGGCKERTRKLNMAVTFRDVTEKTDINRRIFYAVLKRVWFGTGRAIPIAEPASGKQAEGH
jgi:hypothetical protein